MTAEFVTVIETRAVPAGDMTSRAVRGLRIAIANVDGKFFAFDDSCTHRQCSLADGTLAGTTVTCMCHGAEFDVRTGDVLAPPARSPVKVYATRVRGEMLEVEV